MKEENLNKETLNVEAKENISLKPKRKKGKVIIISILLIVAIAIGLYVGYEKVTSNPLNVYKKAINEVYDLASNYSEILFNSDFNLNWSEEPYALTATNLKLSSNNEDLEPLSAYNIDLTTELDYLNKLNNLFISLNDEESTLISAKVYYLNNHLYLESTDIFNRILDLGEYELDFEEAKNALQELNLDQIQIKYSDIKTILEETKSIIINSLDREKFNVSEETITINNEKIATKKFTYLLDEENMKRTIEYISKEISANDKLLTAISNINGLSKDEIIANLEEEIDFNSYEDIEIVLYTKNSQIIAGTIREGDIDYIKFTYQNDLLDLIMADDYTEINLTKKEDTITINYSEDNENILFATITLAKETIKLDLTAYDYSDTYNINFELNNIKNEQSKYEGDFVIGFAIDSYGTKETLELTGSLKLEKKEVSTIDINNSIYYENLTEEEITIIENNLINLFERLGINEEAFL